MKDVYLRPRAEIVVFAPAKAIALEEPGWGWEDDVFGESTGEARNMDDERREGNENK